MKDEGPFKVRLVTEPTVFFVWLNLFLSVYDGIFHRKGIPSDKMDPKGVSDGTTVVISTGASTKTTSAPSEQTSEREERAWKAYFAQTDAPLTTTLLTQVNGEDSNMASTLGFLYDYYGVTEDPTQGPSSPG